MSELTETMISELIDAELDEVCGGIFNIGNPVVQTNTGVQVGVALGGLAAGVAQLLG
jgi:hypothetical protein